MKKIFKGLTIAIIALTAVFACVFAAGCNGDSYEKLDYNFTIVYEDGTPVNGETDGENGKVTTQICTTVCIDLSFAAKMYPDSKGRISLSQEQVNELFDSSTDVTTFAFHVIGVKGCKHDCEIPVDGAGDYEIILAAE